MDKTDPTSLLVYHNRTATAPKYTQNLSHKANVLDDQASTESSDDEPVPNRRGSRQAKRGTTSRKTSSAYANLSGRNSVIAPRWRVAGDSSQSDIIPVSPEQMANAEKAALESGMGEDALVENAGRGIAEAVFASLGGGRLDRKNHNPAPLVVVLVGNNRTGAYALCAGRWLSLRGIRVLGVMCSSEEEELDVCAPNTPPFCQTIPCICRAFLVFMIFGIHVNGRRYERS
jgi:enhancer of mRNA-decapping protein 3